MSAMPHRIAVLCDLRDARGRVLLIHRAKDPNKGLYSPIGGKLETSLGESPAQAARRETREEAGLDLPIDRFRLAGMVSERGYQGAGHWLMFIYRCVGPVHVEERTFREGDLGWHDPADLDSLPRPETDRRVIWPLLIEHEGGFFAVHIDCTGEELRWSIEESVPG